MGYIQYDLEMCHSALERTNKIYSLTKGIFIKRIILILLTIFGSYGLIGLVVGYNLSWAIVSLLVSAVLIANEGITYRIKKAHLKTTVEQLEEVLSAFPKDEKALEEYLKGYKLVTEAWLDCTGDRYWVKLPDEIKYELEPEAILTDEFGLFYSIHKIKDRSEIAVVTYVDEKTRLFIPA